jgi:hypothetical protein
MFKLNPASKPGLIFIAIQFPLMGISPNTKDQLGYCSCRTFTPKYSSILRSSFLSCTITVISNDPVPTVAESKCPPKALNDASAVCPYPFRPGSPRIIESKRSLLLLVKDQFVSSIPSVRYSSFSSSSFSSSS